MITLLHEQDFPLLIKRLIPVLRLRQKGESQKKQTFNSTCKNMRQNEGKRLSGLIEWIFNRTLPLFAENSAG